MLPLCKFYRYLIYRLYHHRNDLSVSRVIVTLSVVHGVQFLTLLTILNFVTGQHYSVYYGSIQAKFQGLVLMVIHYLLFYNKEKWNAIDQEFKDETPGERKVGTVKVISYCIGSIASIFIILPIYDYFVNN